MSYSIYFRRRRRSPLNRRQYLIDKASARLFVTNRLAHFCDEYARLDPSYGDRMQYGKVAIRNQRSRWGSCSERRNLNFNYRLVRIPAHLADYVIVHELCHLVEFNHGQKFWQLVQKVIPDALERRRELRKFRIQ
ncbi:MAG: M48 family metallopeptidase [Patescibacteria group bacterium]|nr:M48 family metallopeptidase [Patescibacteria group bacterium]